MKSGKVWEGNTREDEKAKTWSSKTFSLERKQERKAAGTYRGVVKLHDVSRAFLKLFLHARDSRAYGICLHDEFLICMQYMTYKS